MANVYKNKSITNKTEKSLIFLFVAFLILILSLIFSLAFFSSSKQSSGTITLGEVNFCVYDNVSLSGYVMPADIVPFEVGVINSRNVSGTDTNNLADILLRYKIKFVLENEEFFDKYDLLECITEDEDLYTFDGEYYYYNSVLVVGQNVNICDYVSFSENMLNSFQNKQFDIIFEIDAMQAQNDAYIEEWQDAPEVWKNLIDSQIT